MKILVTGAAGYIGGTFAFEALKKGYKVFGLIIFPIQLICPKHSFKKI